MDRPSQLASHLWVVYEQTALGELAEVDPDLRVVHSRLTGSQLSLPYPAAGHG